MTFISRQPLVFTSKEARYIARARRPSDVPSKILREHLNVIAFPLGPFLARRGIAMPVIFAGVVGEQQIKVNRDARGLVLYVGSGRSGRTMKRTQPGQAAVSTMCELLAICESELPAALATALTNSTTTQGWAAANTPPDGSASEPMDRHDEQREDDVDETALFGTSGTSFVQEVESLMPRNRSAPSRFVFSEDSLRNHATGSRRRKRERNGLCSDPACVELREEHAGLKRKRELEMEEWEQQKQKLQQLAAELDAFSSGLDDEASTALKALQHGLLGMLDGDSDELDSDAGDSDTEEEAAAPPALLGVAHAARGGTLGVLALYRDALLWGELGAEQPTESFPLAEVAEATIQEKPRPNPFSCPTTLINMRFYSGAPELFDLCCTSGALCQYKL
jgi:hypothetical protein